MTQANSLAPEQQQACFKGQLKVFVAPAFDGLASDFKFKNQSTTFRPLVIDFVLLFCFVIFLVTLRIATQPVAERALFLSVSLNVTSIMNCQTNPSNRYYIVNASDILLFGFLFSCFQLLALMHTKSSLVIVTHKKKDEQLL